MILNIISNHDPEWFKPEFVQDSGSWNSFRNLNFISDSELYSGSWFRILNFIQVPNSGLNCICDSGSGISFRFRNEQDPDFFSGTWISFRNLFLFFQEPKFHSGTCFKKQNSTQEAISFKFLNFIQDSDFLENPSFNQGPENQDPEFYKVTVRRHKLIQALTLFRIQDPGFCSGSWILFMVLISFQEPEFHFGTWIPGS